jgi:hypothetical protein
MIEDRRGFARVICTLSPGISFAYRLLCLRATFRARRCRGSNLRKLSRWYGLIALRRNLASTRIEFGEIRDHAAEDQLCVLVSARTLFWLANDVAVCSCSASRPLIKNHVYSQPYFRAKPIVQPK